MKWHKRIPDPPSNVKDPVVYAWMVAVTQQLNSEAFISQFSGTNPNTSVISGIPGQMTVNIGSASTFTRLWIMAGSVNSVSTTSWHPVRVA